MADSSYTIRTRKLMTNRLLMRKQMIVDIIHPQKPCPSRATLTEKVATMFKANDTKCISLFGFRTAFGGGKTTGFCLVYDNLAAFLKFEPRHRQIRNSVGKHREIVPRQQRKERKNRDKKFTGTKNRKAIRASKPTP